MNDTDCDKAISDFGTSTCMFVIPTEPCGTLGLLNRICWLFESLAPSFMNFSPPMRP